MIKILSVTGIGSLHSRKRVIAKRYGIGKGNLAYYLHFGKRSFYFYSANCERPIKPQMVFN